MIKKLALFAGVLGLGGLLLTGCSSDESNNVYVNGRSPAAAAAARPGVPGPAGKPGLPGAAVKKAGPAAKSGSSDSDKRGLLKDK